MKRENTFFSIVWMPFSTMLRRFVQTFLHVPAEEDYDHLTINITTR